jgi:hypothetical protein
LNKTPTPYIFLQNITARYPSIFISAFYYGGTPLIRINWGGEPNGYAENPDNMIFI